MQVETRLAQLGFTLPDLGTEYRENRSGAHFVSHRAVGDVLYCSGTVPMRDGRPYRPGLVGRDLTVEEAYDAARWALVPTLGAIRYALGDLDRVEEAIQMIGYVNSAPGFADQPRVINGAADLLVELYGERGKPTRAAIGCQGLALNSSVEIVLTVRFRGAELRPPLARDHWQR